MSLPIFPALSTPAVLKEFRYCSQMVLPTIYSDALSYYEDICKMVKKLNEVIEQNNTLSEELGKVVVWLEGIKQYLDERDAKVDEDIERLVAKDAELNNLFTSVTTALNARVTSLEGRTANLELTVGELAGANVFATVEDMANARMPFAEGSYASTRGYYYEGDGGDMLYQYSESGNELSIASNYGQNQGYFTPILKSNKPISYGIRPSFTNAETMIRNAEILEFIDLVGGIEMLDFGNQTYCFTDVALSQSWLALKCGELVFDGEFDIGEGSLVSMENIKMSTYNGCTVFGSGTFNDCVFNGGSTTFTFNVNGNSAINNCRFNCRVSIEGNAKFVNCVFDGLDVDYDALCVIHGYRGDFINCGFFSGDSYATSCVSLSETDGDSNRCYLVMLGCYGGASCIMINQNDAATLDILYDSTIDIEDGMIGETPFHDIVGIANFHGLCYGVLEGGYIAQPYVDLNITGLRTSKRELLYLHPFDSTEPADLPEQMWVGITLARGTNIKEVVCVGQISRARIIELATNTTLYDTSDTALQKGVVIDNPCALAVYFAQSEQNAASYVTATIGR